ncbi:MAG: hypothetical protein JST73_00200 [Actinobacteria bacterium]|nr:hypothetical protein [Actinomycetota bacterium]
MIDRIFPLWRRTPRVYRLMDGLHRAGRRRSALVVSEVWKALTGTEIMPGARIDEDVSFIHGQAIVIGESATIGSGSRIWHQVTLGAASRHDTSMPIVGRNVYVYAGAKLIGGITVGDHASIGANAVVTDDVPDGAIVAGIPARVVGWNDGFGPDEPAT